jgi:hypothetical protein
MEVVLFGSKPLPPSPRSITKGTKIANIFVCQNVIRPWSYLFRFEISKRLVSGFDYFAERGFPWRVLRGGYHECVAVEEGGNKVRIWWIIVSEYGVNDGKILPQIVNWGHQMYARALLDAAVRNLRNRAVQNGL